MEALDFGYEIMYTFRKAYSTPSNYQRANPMISSFATGKKWSLVEHKWPLLKSLDINVLCIVIYFTKTAAHSGCFGEIFIPRG